MENRPEKINPWRRHHLLLDVTVQKEKFSCHHSEEVVDATVVTLIFNSDAMEKTNPACSLAITGEEDEEINPQYQES